MQLGICSDRDGNRCFQPAAAKCKVCGHYTCADHKRVLGQISPGVSAIACYRCYEYGYKIETHERYNTVIKKVKLSLCCILNPQVLCACGNKICILCHSHTIKPHDDCEYVRCRRTISLIKARR